MLCLNFENYCTVGTLGRACATTTNQVCHHTIITNLKCVVLVAYRSENTKRKTSTYNFYAFWSVESEFQLFQLVNVMRFERIA